MEEEKQKRFVYVIYMLFKLLHNFYKNYFWDQG